LKEKTEGEKGRERKRGERRKEARVGGGGRFQLFLLNIVYIKIL
jgi:hypothetical protein